MTTVKNAIFSRVEPKTGGFGVVAQVFGVGDKRFACSSQKVSANTWGDRRCSKMDFLLKIKFGATPPH